MCTAPSGIQLTLRFDRPPPNRPDGDLPMLDVLMVIIGLAFFALSVGYVYACDRL